MASKDSRPAVSMNEVSDYLFGSHPISNPIDYITNALTHFQEKEKEVHYSCTKSVYYRKVDNLPPKEDNHSKEHNQDTEKVANPSKCPGLMKRIKIFFHKKKKTRQVGEKGVPTNGASTDGSFEPMTVTMERLRSFHLQMQSNISKLEDVLHTETVEELLMQAEKDVIDDIDAASAFQSIFSDEQVDSVSGNEIHAIMFQPEHPLKVGDNVPLVMVHGLGGGLPTFHKNFGHLNYDRYVYGLDLPGFARSSRMEFPDDPEMSRDMMVDMIEKWKEEMKMKEFILLGHSFGGYIAAAYAVKYPSSVRHLILVEPWGVMSKEEEATPRKIELWQEVAMDVFHFFHIEPFDPIRWSISLGSLLMDLLVPDGQKEIYGEKCMTYFLYANGLPNATGEKAFASISGYTYIWAKEGLEMKQPLIDMDPSVPITFYYGESSNFYNDGGAFIQSQRPNVHIFVFSGASHHVHAERNKLFNDTLQTVLEEINSGADHEREKRIVKINEEHVNDDGKSNKQTSI